MLNGQTTRFAWDDEDRLTGQTFPDGHSDTYTYTGLGMRLRKNDPTGNYWYDADGVSPASPVLSDGHTSFTPGISEVNALGSRFYLADAQGNSRGLLDGGQGNTDGYNWDAFGNSVSRFGTNPTAFAWNEASGYQTDNDSGLKLLGRRYYDSRMGRFISQDPAGDGNNWYGYCGNDPMNGADPSGLSANNAFSAPSAQGEGPNGAFNGQLGAFMGGGEGLDDFFSNEDIAMQKGQEEYQQSAAAPPASSGGIQASYAAWKPGFPGHVVNNSYYPIPVLFDRGGANDPHYILWIPGGYESTPFTDIDYVYYGNDASKSGGFDWRHIRTYDYAVVDNSPRAGSIVITMTPHYPVSYGLPFGWRPAPLSAGQALQDGYINKIYSGPVYPFPLWPGGDNAGMM